MKLLLDANLSWRLTKKLELHFSECIHVDEIGFKAPAKENEIWKFATNHDAVIVTNGDDFLNLAKVKGFPPKVIILRTGNQSNDFIEHLLIKKTWSLPIRSSLHVTHLALLIVSVLNS